tara:strand:- start:15917 stop:16021 length:105 start_codon:yes stop_codon:yes gene_type:complete
MGGDLRCFSEDSLRKTPLHHPQMWVEITLLLEAI